MVDLNLMEENMSAAFTKFLDELTDTNVDLSYFTDFEKIARNIAKIEIHLNALNYLIGKTDLDEAVDKLFETCPKCFSVLTILIAVRKRQNKKTLTNEGKTVLVQSYLSDVEGIKEFIKETGLKDVLQNKQVKNLVDYVFGVEAGLDSHARKNRGGKYMERTIANILRENNVDFEEQVSTNVITGLSWVGTDAKQFDFVIPTKSCVYLVEANYYSSGGSKLSEVARSYTDVSALVEGHDGFEFVWVTDGLGWRTTKNSLNAAFEKIPKLYNLKTFAEFVEELAGEVV